MSYSVTVKTAGGFGGVTAIPGDKSITHRALILAALGNGRARVRNILASADCLSTLACLKQLGVEIDRDSTEVVVVGRGLGGFSEPLDVLDVGNSGTALRVLPAVLAAQPFFSVLTGDDSIRKRPVDRVIRPLSLMGGRLWAREGGRLAPVAVAGGRLQGIVYELPVASAQVKTAVLLAGLLAEGRTTVIEPVPSRDHTEIMLAHLGARLSVEALAGGGRRLTVEGGIRFDNRDLLVPGDFSSAAFFLAAGVLASDRGVTVEGTGLNQTRTGFLDVLNLMGGAFALTPSEETEGEPAGSVFIRKGFLRGSEIGGALIPRIIDELPLVALLATQAEGRTVIKDAAELRVKETDRIGLVAAELAKMGAAVRAMPDGFIIDGPTPLHGAAVDSQGDHRLAMMLAVAALVAEGSTTIGAAEAVNVSFPDFFDRLAALGADVVVKSLNHEPN